MLMNAVADYDNVKLQLEIIRNSGARIIVMGVIDEYVDLILRAAEEFGMIDNPRVSLHFPSHDLCELIRAHNRRAVRLCGRRRLGRNVPHCRRSDRTRSILESALVVHQGSLKGFLRLLRL